MTAEQENYDPNELDTYRYSTEFSKFRRFLWFCAGADSELLKHCPYSERVKEEGIGGIVLATAMLALLSGGYAMYTVFSPKVGSALSDHQQLMHFPTVLLAIVIGAVWALVIFNLDRFVVSSTGHGDGTENITLGEIWGALPRLILAIFIGITLSKPLEIRIMKTEIEAQLNKEQTKYEIEARKLAEDDYKKNTEEIAKAQAEWKSELAKKDGLFEKMRLEAMEQQNQFTEEVAGRVGSGKVGEGPAAKVKREAFEQREKQRSSDVEAFKPRRAELEKNVKEADAKLANERTKLDDAYKNAKNESNKLDGLVKRIEIANEISPAASWALMLLLIAIEITPILSKMMIIRGPYDYLRDNQNEIVKAKYAIETTLAPEHGSSERQVAKDVFHQAETIRAHNVGQLGAERKLADTARDKYVDDTSAKIKDGVLPTSAGTGA